MLLRGSSPFRRPSRRRGAVLLLGVTLVAAGCGGATATSDSTTSSTPSPPAVAATYTPGPWDWPTYGHDAQHTFHGQTTLTLAQARTLRKAWFFPTGDAVTATPTVVGGTVYVGSWDDNFYALNLESGKVRWKTRLKSQNGITPYPGQVRRDTHSDGGLVTGSAWFEPAAAGRPPLVIFGGGYTLYALDATDGKVFWEHDYSGRPGPLAPDQDQTRIFSSPVVVGGNVI